MRPLKILDLYAGRKTATKAFADRGHEVITVDINPRFGCDITADVLELQRKDLPDDLDFIWASPPCEAFSVASIGHHWAGGWRVYQPKTDHAKLSLSLVSHTVGLIAMLAPRYGFAMENPRGVLRKLAPVSGLDIVTVTYCQYGESRMKPTDLWGRFPKMRFRPMCKNGDPCHEAAPRGAKTGTQGLKGAEERAVIPYKLSMAFCKAVEKAAYVSRRRNAKE